MALPSHLNAMRARVEAIARAAGLDFYETIFEVLSFQEINMVAAYGGFPSRYPHWRFGMEYEELSKGYAYGLQRIYEMVINNDPCYAYLLDSNADVDQKLVMAHVYAHCDFFKNNRFFEHTNRHMMDEMANHATRINRYVDKAGYEEVEKFVDVCLSIEDLIDPFQPERPPRMPVTKEEETPIRPGEMPARKEYMRPYINPPEELERLGDELKKKREAAAKFPARPERDILLFLMEHAPIDEWKRDVLSIMREESYYYAPQKQTKIMNEGWASFWHSRIMTTRALLDSEVVDYADHHSGTVAMAGGRLNPYKIGIELFRDIEQRWNRGQFGKDYEECDDLLARRTWDLKLGAGMRKIFEVRALYNDVNFIDEFLTEDFCRRHKLFTFGYDEDSNNWVIKSRQFGEIKRQLLFNLTNFGNPIIAVEDGNFRNRGELLLVHRYEGMDLRLDWARDTLQNINSVWKRPVHIFTNLNGRNTLLSFDGTGHGDKEMEKPA